MIVATGLIFRQFFTPRLGGKLLAALGATARENLAAANGGLASTETVAALAF